MTKREAPLGPRIDLWHAAGRAARETRKRRLATLGVLWSAPLLLVGSFVSHLLSAGPRGALDGIARPLPYVLAPLKRAYENDADVALLGYLAWQGVLLCLLWGWFGGLLHRMAAAELTQSQREDMRAIKAFGRRHWRAFVGARLALFVGTVVPLALAVLLATGGRIDGWLGGLLLTVAALAAVVLCFASVLVGSSCAVAGFLTAPTVAVEDSDAFDALSRTFGYAGAGLPRLLAVRLTFFSGVLLGSLWRLILTIATILAVLACLRLGAGHAAMDRLAAILGARGQPDDAARLGITFGDYLFAGVVSLLLFLLLVRWLADLVTRVICARCATYLVLRREIDLVPIDVLSTAPAVSPFRTAEEAGLVEVGRVDEAD